MKKIFTHVAFFICATLMLSGCQTVQQMAQNPDLQNIAKAVLTTMLTPQQGTTQNYSGTLSAQLLQKNASGEYIFVNGTGKKTPSTATLPVTSNATSAGIQIPAMTIDGAQMSLVQIANLANTNGTIAVGDNTSADATLTVGGKAYPISAVYFDGCTFTTDGTFTGKTMQIYFGANSEFVADMTFTGKAVQ